MVRTYFINKDDAPVKLKVTVNSIGIASSIVQRKRSGGSVELLKESKNATGSIPNFTVGASKDIINSTLVINSIIDLANVDTSLWDDAFNDLDIRYTLNGGVDGEQEYECDSDDKFRIQDNKFIVASKAIKLTEH